MKESRMERQQFKLVTKDYLSPEELEQVLKDYQWENSGDTNAIVIPL